MERPGAGRRPELLIAFACAAALVALAAWLGRLDLLDPDEGRHAEIAREMLAAGRWLTPVLHGEPYYDKPAAFYWLLGGSFQLLGLNAFAARLPSVVAALWTIFVAARFAARAYGPEAGAFAATGLATTLAFVALGRTVIIDMSFTAALTTAAAWLGLWHLDDPARRRAVWPFYFAIGIGCLLKGPAAAVIGATLVAGIVATQRELAILKALKPVRGALLALAVALPWYAAAWYADPGYVFEFVVRHNVERFLRPINSGHDEPWYYYLVALPVALLPWTPVVLAAAIRRLGRDHRTNADLYCAIWAGSVLLLFMPAGTKLLTYLLPAFPPLIVLGAAWLSDGADHERTRRWLAPYAAAWALVLAVAAVACVAVAVLQLERWPSRAWLAGLALLPLFFALRARRAADVLRSAAAIAGASLVCTVVAYGFFADVLNSLRGTRRAAELVGRSLVETGAELVAYHCAANAIAFYAGRPAVRARDATHARRAVLDHGSALVTERKRLGELGFDPPPSGVEIVWTNVNGLVLLVRADRAGDGGEGRESNPPPTLKAGVTVLKTGRATGPDPSPRGTQ